MKSKLDQIEARLQAFIENNITLFPNQKRQQALVSKLINKLRETLMMEPYNEASIPGLYTIYLPPEIFTIWQSKKEFIFSLAKELQEIASEVGEELVDAPVIQLAEDHDLSPDELKIIASHFSETIGETASMELIPDSTKGPIDPRPVNAFLIVDSDQVYPLNQTVINIGRRIDNHLVLSDARVSRNHAQLRAIKGHYVLFDLNSTGGTYVNSQRINQKILKAGDVITLAGFPIIYGEDLKLNVEETKELPTLSPLHKNSQPDK